jgi:signal transduction histidine kinase
MNRKMTESAPPRTRPLSSPGAAKSGTSRMKRRVAATGAPGGSPGSDMGTGLAARAVRAPADLPWPLASALIAAGLFLAWALSYFAGGEDRVPPHLFYVPILLAAARFGLRGAVLIAFTSGLVAGPLLPEDVSSGTAQRFSDWGARALFFLAIGSFMAILITRLQASLAQELRFALKERDLAVRKAVLVQAVSHEFRTPLTVILGVARTLEEYDFVTEEARPLIEGLTRASRRLDDLVTGLLAVAGTLGEDAASAQEKIDLREVCREIAHSLAGAEGEQRIRFAAVTDDSAVEASPGLVVPLLRAVIDNALKFSPPGSPVDVNVRRSREGIEVRVRDQGPGIGEGYLPEAFEPFTQEDQSRGGLGIGLFVARNLAGELGARLELGRHSDGGTEALVIFPETMEDSTPEAHPQA